jgi:hypothetical protein
MFFSFKKTHNMSGPLTTLSSVFLASASAVTAGGLMIHLRNNFGNLERDGSITCTLSGVGTDANCSLSGSYGDGILAVNIISVVLNGILFFLLLVKWMQTYKKGAVSGWIRTTFTLVSLAVMLAIATAGYNLYIQHNFGKELVNGGFGKDCDVVGGCEQLDGSVGQNMLGLNAATIAMSGLALLFHSGMVMRQFNVLNRLK